MDTSETFIKMCEKAEEIQGLAPKALWEGNRSFQLSGNNVYAKSPTSKRFVWLPRQDQLQEMICWNITGRFGVLMIDGLMQFAKEFYKPVSFGDDSVTWEQLWLAFVMKERWNKIWNGEDWIKS